MKANSKIVKKGRTNSTSDVSQKLFMKIKAQPGGVGGSGNITSRVSVKINKNKTDSYLESPAS